MNKGVSTVSMGKEDIVNFKKGGHDETVLDKYRSLLKVKLGEQLKTLDEYQSEILSVGIDEPLCVIANAGSGKTYCTVSKALKMMIVDGIPAEKIVMIAFMTRNASQMEEKMRKFFVDAIGEEGDKIVLPHIRTVHSFCIMIMRDYLHFQPRTTLKDNSDRVLRAVIAKKFNIEDEKKITLNSVGCLFEVITRIAGRGELHRFVGVEIDRMGNTSKIGNRLNNESSKFLDKYSYTQSEIIAGNRTKEDFDCIWDEFSSDMKISIRRGSGESKRNECKLLEKSEFLDIVKEYTKVKSESRSFDFYDMIWHLTVFLSQHKEKLAALSKIFEYFLVDEAQDINPLNYSIVKILAGDKEKITLIGDQKQQLYLWRGAYTGFLDRMGDYSKRGVIVKKLLKNYRSPTPLIWLANKFAKGVFPEHYGVVEDSVPVKGFEVRGSYVRKWFDDVEDEMKWVVDEIERLHKEFDTPYKDMAILCAINNEVSNYEDYFIAKNIPMKMRFDNRSILNKSAYKLVFAIYSMVLNPFDIISFNIFMKYLGGLGEGYYRKINKEIASLDVKNRNVFTLMDKVRVNDKQDKILKKFVNGVLVPLSREFEELASFEKFNLKLKSWFDGNCKFDKEPYVYRDISINVLRPQLFQVCEVLNRIYTNLKSDNSGFRYKSEKERFQDVYETLSLSQDINIENKKFKKDDRDAVTVSTVHSFKGKEAKFVFYSNLRKRYFIHFDKGLDDEESRIGKKSAFYVGVTRSVCKLYLTYSYNIFNSARQKEPSKSNEFLEYFIQCEREVTEYIKSLQKNG